MILQFVDNNIRVMMTEDIVNVRFDNVQSHYSVKDHQRLIEKLRSFCDGSAMTISKNRYYNSNLVMMKSRDRRQTGKYLDSNWKQSFCI